jgi:flagellar basal-body rod modification protein FlgD
MGDLIKPVKDGKVEETSNGKAKKTSSSSSNELGKEAFLQLLVTQMKYQDPLNPNTDTEYIAQLATFSQLEQLQNLSSAASNSQAFSLVGRTIILKTENTTGSSYITGKVDYVTLNGRKTQLSVNGKLYDFDQLDTVLSEAYVIEQNQPKIENPIALKYDASKPQDLSFTVNLGTGDTVADDVIILIGDKQIDSSLVDVSGNKVTIKKSAFTELEDGTYNLAVVFNDPLYTIVKDKVTLQVQNSTADTKDSSEPSENESMEGSTEGK